MFANVAFRTPALADAGTIWYGMLGGNGLFAAGDGALFAFWSMLPLLAAFAIIWLLPNSQQIMRRFNPAFNWSEWKAAALAPLRWAWTPSTFGIAFAGAALFFGIMFIQRGTAVFLYFNF